MTEFASVARRNVPGIFAFGDDPVVATKTGSDDRAVINPCWFPAPGAMAVLTGGSR